MKRILIVTPTLQSGGGVIRGLQNMLALLPTDGYKIDVLPMGYSSRDNVPLTNCRVLSDNFLLTAITAVFVQTEGYKYRGWLRFSKGVLALLGKLGKRSQLENKLFRKASKSYSGYHVVIAYQEGPCTRFVQYIDSPYRIAWIHCDYSEYRKVYLRSEEGIYEKYQRIVCVSKFTLKNFQSIYPSLKERSMYIYNLLDKDFIRQSALENVADFQRLDDDVRILSIGRLHPVKQFHLIPGIISKMLSNGTQKFKWGLIGSGDSSELLRIMAEVEKYNVKNHFEYLGSKYNPYPYIKHSDILVSTSSSEACPFVVNEARVLDVPVVSNDYPSITEFIHDGINGHIIPIEEMAEILSKLIVNVRSLDNLKEGMQKDNYDNDGIITQICNLLDGNL